MRRAKLIRDGAQPCQRPWPLSKHFAVAEADAIDNKMRVDVLAVDVGGDEHLALWPSPAISCASSPVTGSLGAKDCT